MHATFFVSLWKCEKCANQFLVIARRERLWKDRWDGGRGWGRKVKANSRVVLESSCTCVIPIRCMWYHARVHHESARQLQVTCIIISESSPGKPSISAYRSTNIRISFPLNVASYLTYNAPRLYSMALSMPRNETRSCASNIRQEQQTFAIAKRKELQSSCKSPHYLRYDNCDNVAIYKQRIISELTGWKQLCLKPCRSDKFCIVTLRYLSMNI